MSNIMRFGVSGTNTPIDFSKYRTVVATADQYSKSGQVDCGNGAIEGAGITLQASDTKNSESNEKYWKADVYGSVDGSTWNHIYSTGTCSQPGGGAISWGPSYIGSFVGYRYFRVTWTNHAYVYDMNARITVAYFTE